jgi:hypothetical protein
VGACTAHSLGLDPELAMEVGKRQAKENCVKFLATTCLNQYARYLAVSGAGVAAVGAGLEAQKHIAQSFKKDGSSGRSGSGDGSSSSKDSGKDSGKPPEHGDGGGDDDGNGPKIAGGVGGLGLKQVIEKSSKLSKKSAGRSGKEKKLKELMEDDKVSSADRGWIKQEVNLVKSGKKNHLRNPPGKDLAHNRGYEASKGYDYSHTKLQDRDLHRLQHKYDKNGLLNKTPGAKPDGT